MFRGDILIDGYNVLHAASFKPRSELEGGGLKRARQELIRLLSRKLTPRERQRTTVVFDAPAQTMSPGRSQEMAGLHVLFAGREGDADETIERLIQQTTAPRRLCVVSSDRRLQQAARRRRASSIGSDAFLRRLSRRGSPSRHPDGQQEPAAKRTGRLPPAEVEAWLRVFEEIETQRCTDDGIPDVRPRRADSNLTPPAHKPQGSEDKLMRKCPADRTIDTADLADEILFWESRISELDDEDSRRVD